MGKKDITSNKNKKGHDNMLDDTSRENEDEDVDVDKTGNDNVKNCLREKASVKKSNREKKRII